MKIYTTNQYTLYQLKDSRNNNVFYIGITCVPLNRRLSKHLHKSEWARNPTKRMIIHDIIKLNLKPIIEPIFENLTYEEAKELEIEVILCFRAAGFPLTNISDGGGLLSKESRIKISQKIKGKNVSVETRNLLSKINKGKKLSLQTINKLSESHKGKKHSQDTKKIISIKTKGKNNPFYGQKHTDETKQLLRLKRNSIKIGQYDLENNLIKIYDSIHLAANKNGFHQSSIRKVVHGKQKTSYGFYWKKIK